MLFNPDWKKPTPEDFLKPHLLAAWLEQQDPAAVYEFCDPNICLLGQYLRHCGFSGRDVIVELGLLPAQDEPWYGAVAGTPHWGAVAVDYTFGAALERCRAFT